MALAVPLSRFTSRVGGGSAFYVRPLMRTTVIIIAFIVASLAAHAQLATTFIISSNDVVQSSIWYGHPRTGTNSIVVVKFAFTETGAKRLEEFYRAHTVGDEVCWQCGSFLHPFKLDDRKFFGRDGFWGLSEADAKALLAGLRGER